MKTAKAKCLFMKHLACLFKHSFLGLCELLHNVVNAHLECHVLIYL